MKSNKKKPDRVRTNLLRKWEAKTISYLCPRIPKWIKPDHLTLLGLFGSFSVFVSLILAIWNPFFLFMGVVGLGVQWFGDSLDGRIAYFRNTPRKWYGWALDINADWISTSIIGLGFYFYFPEYNFVAFLFVVAYGGSMILALLRYKITDNYQIDSLFFGPTEMRILISIFLVLEIYLPGSLLAFGAVGSAVIMILNVYESVKILISGDQKDRDERHKRLFNGC